MRRGREEKEGGMREEEGGRKERGRKEGGRREGRHHLEVSL